MKPKEAHNAPVILQPQLIHVEVHPVEALQLKGHMLIEGIGHSSR
jgi:hypothetical protein